MPAPPQLPLRVHLTLAVAVLGISSSAILVRGMDAGPAAITVWRCAIAAALLAPWTGPALRLGRADQLRLVAAGVLLGAHFWSWFASLAATSVLRSTVLVALVPLWSAGLDWATGRGRPDARFVGGITLAIVGVALFATRGGPGALTGDLLAVLAGLLWALHLALASDLRQRLGALPYMGGVSVFAALAALPAAALRGEALAGYPPATWALLAAAALGPQLLGHMGFGYALRFVRASTIAALLLLEPVGATLLAAGLLGEVPPAPAVAGGALVLAGVAVALRTR